MDGRSILTFGRPGARRWSIEAAQLSGRVSKDLNSYAAAAAAMAMLERLLTYRSVFVRRGVTTEAMAATLAAILYETVTGHPS